VFNRFIAYEQEVVGVFCAFSCAASSELVTYTMSIRTGQDALCIVDVGGILSMLNWYRGYGHGLPSLLSLVQEQEELNFVDFYAYEGNHAMQEACQEELGGL
jgi:hypothetical protein